MKYITQFLLFLLILTFGCSSDGKECCTVIDVSLLISLTGNDGTDLLNPEEPDHYDEASIDIYALIDGEEKRVFDGNLDLPEHFKVVEIDGQYYMNLFVNETADDDNLAVTYIKWNESDTDTLMCDFNKSHNNIILTEVWYNGELKWKVSDGDERVVNIVKE
ncbi:hypothetical protein V6R21_17405 [Limibacter armeniacum]|uniref:hypothetical protein n=1 Tax=Limibacter armeniacum TaxID=466084 RepID=UPI002FE57A42